MPYAKVPIRVKVPKRSGFDKTHRNSGTGLCGQLIPLLCDEVIPNSRVSLRINLATQLPPLVSDTYMNVKQKVEAFFVPGRLLCKSYEGWFCDRTDRVFANASTVQSQSAGSFVDALPAIPCLKVASPSNLVNIGFGAGTLADYLGYGRTIPDADTFNILPFIAYHLVWQEYYRNPNVQNPAFVPSLSTVRNFEVTSFPRIANITSSYFHYANTGLTSNDYLYTLSGSNEDDFKCADGVSLFALRQRNFGLDLYTSARLSAQRGSASSVTLGIPAGTDAAGGSTQFTIAQLRAANSLQQFRERNNLPGSRLVEQVKARYGANLSDGVAQRPICLGSLTYDYGSTGVSQTAPADSGAAGSNPFDGVAAQYGRAYANGSNFIIDDFVANEPGYILVLQSQVPEVTYSYGAQKMFHRYIGAGSIVDMANPLLQNVGDEPIYQNELNPVFTSTAVFGYQDRFYDFMYKKNSAHGLLRNGESLAQFVLQRPVVGAVSLGSSFLEIPINYLDQVMTVAASAAGFTYWYDAMLDYKVSQPLAEFSIPSLQDPAYEHGESVNIRRNGQIF